MSHLSNLLWVFCRLLEYLVPSLYIHTYSFISISNLLFREESEGKLKGILGYTDEDLVSTDFLGDSR